MNNPFRDIAHIAWERFKIIAAILGDIQGRFIATLFYFTILVPFGLGSRLFSDPLHLTSKNAHVRWLERKPVDHQLDSAKQQG